MFAAMKTGTMADYTPSTTEPLPAVTSDSSGDRKFYPQAKVFNIPDGTDEEEFKAFFSSVAVVKSIKILPVREGKDTTMGFVSFETDSDVEKAVQEKNDTEFNGSTLKVVNNDRNGGGGSGSGGGRSFSDSNNNTSTQVKVFNIPDGSDENELKSFFSEAGNVTRVKVLPCREGKDVTLGFIHFITSEEADKAVEIFKDRDFNGSSLRVMKDGGSSFGGGGVQRNDDRGAMRSMGRGAIHANNVNFSNNSSGGSMSNGVGSRERGPQAKVFGIPEGTSEDEVRDYFSSAGTVTNVKILPLREGKDNHLGFVEFSNDAEVQAAVDQFDGTDLNGSKLKVMLGNNQSNAPVNGNHFRSSPSYEMNNGRSEFTMRVPREDRSGGYSNGVDNFNNVDNFGGMDGMDGGIRMAPITYIPPPPPDTENEIFEQGINQGINFQKYDQIPVELTGENPTKAINEFQEAGLHEVCMRNIARAKYQKPTPVQKYALPAVLAKRDVMACAQTGSGKTASFLLPVISQILSDGFETTTGMGGPVKPLALVIVPTRELAIQIFNEARKFSFESQLRPVVIYGGVSVHHQSDVLARGCQICIATPGRLDDFVKRGKLSCSNLKFLIFDEADRMLDMGFGQQINDIINNSEMPPKGERNTLMFSATFPKEIQQMAAEYLHQYLYLTVGRVGGACADVQQKVIQVAGNEKRNQLEEILKESGADKTMVFVERKKDADFLAMFLSQRNYPATSINGDRSQQERESALLDFRKGRAPVLVATAVAARGLDIDDVKHVINYDLPKEPTEYVHRIGRTGRIGNRGKATSFYDALRDENLARPIVRMLSEACQEVPDWLEQAALRATGTGYGINQKSGYRDQRRNQRGGDSNDISNGGMRSTPSQSGQKTIATADDGDDEEW